VGLRLPARDASLHLSGPLLRGDVTTGYSDVRDTLDDVFLVLHSDDALRDDTITALLIIGRDSDLRVIAAAFMVHSYCIA